jgi:hypothetical protein
MERKGPCYQSEQGSFASVGGGIVLEEKSWAKLLVWDAGKVR